MRGVCERHAQNLQHFIGASFQLHVMLHDGNQAIGADGRVNLYPDGILGGAPEFLNLEVLL